MAFEDLSHLIPQLNRLAEAHVLCIGDVMLDHYVYGHVDRVSPEAPIPVVRVDRETSTLGGAGNVLRNLRALGAHASFVSVVGDDQAGRDINRLIGEEGELEAYLLMERGRPSTLKTRYVGGYQQILRVDRESVAPIGPHVREDLIRVAKDTLADQSVVVLSDYAKGVLGDGVAGELIDACRAAGVWVIVDPKGLDYTRYRGANLLTPNRRELAEASKMPVESDAEIVAAALHLIETCSVDAVLVTRSQDGMTLVDPSISPQHIPAAAREVFDVSGAGDTVLATIAAGLGAGLSLLDAARLSNIAAGIVVGKVGTAVTPVSELVAVLNERSELDKHLPLSLALDRVSRWHRATPAGRLHQRLLRPAPPRSHLAASPGARRLRQAGGRIKRRCFGAASQRAHSPDPERGGPDRRNRGAGRCGSCRYLRGGHADPSHRRDQARGPYQGGRLPDRRGCGLGLGAGIWRAGGPGRSQPGAEYDHHHRPDNGSGAA